MDKLSGRLFATTLVLFVVLCGTGYVNGLTCYECTSSDGNLCGDSLNKTAMKPTDCNVSVFTQGNTKNEESICISMKEQNSTHAIHTRRCGLKSEASICDGIGENRGFNLRCLTCEKDLCNASVHSHTNLFMFVFIVINCISLIKIYL